jgi:hypothetical protein
VTRALARLALASATLAMSACAPPGGPQQLAVATTRAVYADDLDGTIAHFDPALRNQVTSGAVGQLSTTLRALGAMQGFTPVGSTPAQGRYDYRVAFDKGQMLVQLRLDGDRQIAAYRITPLAAQ